MRKADQNKKAKIERLLDASFELFTTKGIHKTTISDIVEKAGVAKGTFYLYFKDKYDLRNKLIAHKSSKLLIEAYDEMCKENYKEFEDKFIFMTDFVLDVFAENRGYLALIYKDLGWAIFKKALTTLASNSDSDFLELYHKMISESGHTFRDPDVMLFITIELIGSTGYSSIMYNDPISPDELKPHLAVALRSIIQSYIVS